MKIDVNRMRGPWGHEVTVRGTAVAVLAPVDAPGCFDLIDERDPAQAREFVRRIFPEPLRGLVDPLSDGEVFTIAHVYGQWSAQYFADVRRIVALAQEEERRPRGEESAPAPAPSQGEGETRGRRLWGETSGGVAAG